MRLKKNIKTSKNINSDISLKSPVKWGIFVMGTFNLCKMCKTYGKYYIRVFEKSPHRECTFCTFAVFSIRENAFLLETILKILEYIFVNNRCIYIRYTFSL